MSTRPTYLKKRQLGGIKRLMNLEYFVHIKGIIKRTRLQLFLQGQGQKKSSGHIHLWKCTTPQQGLISPKSGAQLSIMSNHVIWKFWVWGLAAVSQLQGKPLCPCFMVLALLLIHLTEGQALVQTKSYPNN